jgi:plastocyanin
MAGCGRAARGVRGPACALLLILAAPASETSASTGEEPGSVGGTVTIGPELSGRRVGFNLYSDPSRAAVRAPRPSLTDELANVVVYLEPLGPSTAPLHAPSGAYRIEQRGLSFEPHVLAVPRGATVEFPNGDVVFHNVFSLSKAASFDLGRYPSGASKSVRFDTPGIVKVFCHIHSDMSAIVVVLDQPFFDQPDREGRFSIARVPPGAYRAVAWHERTRPVPREVRVEAGGAVTLDFVIPLEIEAADGG